MQLVKSARSTLALHLGRVSWFTYFRIYGPQRPAFDGTWKLNDIAEGK